jgi:hypothetical protein
VHLDIHTDDLAAEIARLEELGAERVQQVHSWWILRDPAGLRFASSPSPPAHSTTATRNAGTNTARLDPYSSAIAAVGLSRGAEPVIRCTG